MLGGNGVPEGRKEAGMNPTCTDCTTMRPRVERMMTMKEAADAVGIPLRTMYEEGYQGRLKVVQLRDRRKFMVSASELERWAEANIVPVAR